MNGLRPGENVAREEGNRGGHVGCGPWVASMNPDWHA